MSAVAVNAGEFPLKAREKLANAGERVENETDNVFRMHAALGISRKILCAIRSRLACSTRTHFQKERGIRNGKMDLVKKNRRRDRVVAEEARFGRGLGRRGSTISE
jgi:hypothetical protein